MTRAVRSTWVPVGLGTILVVLAVAAARAQTSCDDGNACTTGDTIVNGVCVGGSPRDCSDGNVCTDDACDPALGCVHADSSQPCDDGNQCTSGDVCRNGACIGGNTASGCAACEAIAVLPATGGTFSGATSGTGTLTGSCGTSGPSPERVYAWTPSSSGTATVQTCGTGTLYDSVVYVRGGACTGAQLACNDDTAGCNTGEPNDHHGSRVTFTATAGVTYYLIVDGYNGAHGTYALTVTPPATCGNDVREGGEECDGADHAGCPSGQCQSNCVCAPPPQGLPDLVPEISDVSLDLNTTVAAGDAIEGCAEATSGVDLLRFGVRSINAGTAALTFGDPACPLPCDEHPLAVCGNPDFVCSPAAGHNHPHYTNYARYELLDATGQTLVVGHKQGYCLRDTTCASPVYTCTDQGISAGCSDLYGANLGCQYLDVTDVPAGQYTLRVTMDPFGRIAELSESNNVAEVPVQIARPTPTGATPSRTATPASSATRTPTPVATATAVPGGGTCGAPIVIPAAGGVMTGTTSGASAVQGTCGVSAPSPEIVYQWTPAASGTASVSTCSTTVTRYDTIVYLRNGGCTGTELACNDDTTGCFTAEPNDHHGSRITPAVTAGQTYFIVVDGYGGAHGDFALTVVPPNGGGATPPPAAPTRTPTRTPTPTAAATPVASVCSAPRVVPADGGTLTGVTSGGSTLAGTCATSQNSPEQVFQWTPSRSGTATIATCGSATTFDTVVYLRRDDCQTGAQLACNDDTAGCTTGEPNDHHGSTFTAAVSAGTTYFIVVDGYNGAGGAYSLRVSLP